jgi:hypothetical protein
MSSFVIDDIPKVPVARVTPHVMQGNPGETVPHGLAAPDFARARFIRAAGPLTSNPDSIVK